MSDQLTGVFHTHPQGEELPKLNLPYYWAEQFYDEVCRRAEKNMALTGKLEGAHYAAMQSVLAEWKARA